MRITKCRGLHPYFSGNHIHILYKASNIVIITVNILIFVLLQYVSAFLSNSYSSVVSTGKHHAIKKLLQSILLSCKYLCRGASHFLCSLTNLHNTFCVVNFIFLANEENCVKSHDFGETCYLHILFVPNSTNNFIFRVL